MSVPSHNLDRLQATFDHDGIVANAGLVVPFTYWSTYKPPGPAKTLVIDLLVRSDQRFFCDAEQT